MGFFSGLVGGLLGGGSSSKSSSSSSVQDERVGAEGNATAFRSTGENAIITVGSDDTAQFAINSSTQALTATTNLIGDVFSKILNSTDTRQERAENNIAQQQRFSADLISNQSQTSDQRLINLMKYGLLAGVSIYAFKSGIITKTIRTLK